MSLYASEPVKPDNPPLNVENVRHTKNAGLARPLRLYEMALNYLNMKELEMSDKNKQFDSLQGKQGNDSEGIPSLQNTQGKQNSEKQTEQDEQTNSEGLQQGGNRGNSNQGN